MPFGQPILGAGVGPFLREELTQGEELVQLKKEDRYRKYMRIVEEAEEMARKHGLNEDIVAGYREQENAPSVKGLFPEGKFIPGSRVYSHPGENTLPFNFPMRDRDGNPLPFNVVPGPLNVGRVTLPAG